MSSLIKSHLYKKKRKKQAKINNKLREKLYGHLAFASCCYCKLMFLVEQLTIEHLTPLCQDGTNDPSNIALACRKCNQDKGKEDWEKVREMRKEIWTF